MMQSSSKWKVENGRVEPIGVLVGVEPWKYPYHQLVRFVGPIFALGNRILMKHASGVPQCALAFEKILKDAGAPDGATQISSCPGSSRYSHR